MFVPRKGHEVFVLRVFISLVWVRILGEGFSRICISFPGAFFNLVLHQNEHMGVRELGIILWSVLLFYFYFGSLWL